MSIIDVRDGQRQRETTNNLIGENIMGSIIDALDNVAVEFHTKRDALARAQAEFDAVQPHIDNACQTLFESAIINRDMTKMMSKRGINLPECGDRVFFGMNGTPRVKHGLRKLVKEKKLTEADLKHNWSKYITFASDLGDDKADDNEVDLDALVEQASNEAPEAEEKVA